ncbi:MAG: methyltransferase domain-containing protein [Planctomycetes bacterium]|nr:methyltransferase domain-containing protein [Planctomycetota bacterium]
MSDLVTLNISAAVRDRYSEAAKDRTAELCCPVSYDPKYLAAIPIEVLDRDYGCGDPSKFVRTGDVVLDLGSGGGKICFIAAQVVGSTGRVIGVDCNDDMLSLARGSQAEVASRIGYANVEFRKGQIQDLKLDLDQLESHLNQHPVGTSSEWLKMQELANDLRRESPLIPDDSIDVVVSNCVLNLVDREHRRQLFREIHRVLKPGGRAVISDIVSDRDIPSSLQNKAELWSGCLSGAFREDLFLAAFEAVGFIGLEILERQPEPWRVAEGIEFRSQTVRAHKRRCMADMDSRSVEVTYRGPWKSVQDDAGQVFPRGERVAVQQQTAQALRQAPYAGHVLFVGDATTPAESCCGPTGCC